jgi:hypothetical protein
VAAVAAVAEPAVAAVAAVAEPAVVPPETTQTSMLVDVRIDSTPSGAAVTLVDRGKSQFVGNTPVNATVDASLEYDLVFAYPNKPAQVEHLDARTTRHVAVTLGARAAAARMDSAPPHVDKPSAGSVPAPVKPPAKAIEPAGEGTLMISSKPPCEIVIDGKPTGLTTPQRAITLPAGNHKITLVNSSDQAIRRTVSVQIMANTTEKVIEDLMK